MDEESLERFTNEAPDARRPVYEFMRAAATSIHAGALVLDVGAGLAPYRTLFSHTNYRTCDHAQSIYETVPDLVAPADSLPFPDCELDAIICTEVLEHTPEPWRVLQEFYRVLRPGGRTWITAPLTWYLHEEPFDFYRYTSHGLRFLLERAGFVDITVTPLTNSFATLAQFFEHLGWMMGRGEDGYDDQRAVIGQMMASLAPMVRGVGNFDTQWLLPINYSAVATKPV